MSTTAIPAAPEFGTPAALAELIGNRWSYQQVAAALNCTERAVYSLIIRYRIPYIKVLNKRYVEPSAIREAVLRDQANTPPRGRGRPRKVT
jgi:hypothetical protein